MTVQVGQRGNQNGTEFWQTTTKEHLAGENRYVPRVAVLDLEPGALDVVKSSQVGAIFKPDNYVHGAGNNWAKRHYTAGAELIDEGVDVTRKETEACDCPEGYYY